MDLPQAFISAAELIFFAAWLMVLAALSVVAFGRDISASIHQRREQPPRT
jgi:hypothetical protein